MKPIVYLKSGRAFAKEIASVCHSHSLIIYKKVGKEQTFTQYILCQTLLDVLHKAFNI